MKSKDDYKNTILELLAKRSPGKTICPSEILEVNEKQDIEKMDAVRRAAIELASIGDIVITQKGHVVDPKNFKGPIRLKLNAK